MSCALEVSVILRHRNSKDFLSGGGMEKSTGLVCQCKNPRMHYYLHPAVSVINQTTPAVLQRSILKLP